MTSPQPNQGQPPQGPPTGPATTPIPLPPQPRRAATPPAPQPTTPPGGLSPAWPHTRNARATPGPRPHDSSERRGWRRGSDASAFAADPQPQDPAQTRSAALVQQVDDEVEQQQTSRAPARSRLSGHHWGRWAFVAVVIIVAASLWDHITNAWDSVTCTGRYANDCDTGHSMGEPKVAKPGSLDIENVRDQVNEALDAKTETLSTDRLDVSARVAELQAAAQSAAPTSDFALF